MSRIQKIIDAKLTIEKVAADRQNAFEIGAESYLENLSKTASAEEVDHLRALMADGLQELANKPELLQKALAGQG